ncbi:SRF-type transcription factor family protein [Abeliophyllum distichum]|uniref:SRF-type transcription factor family protein n=2 Tax=Abeliophyllum distichum TaxID=126358 RepID=A0ABD1VVX9_9LAMI
MSQFLSPKENNNQPPENTDSMSTKKREKAMKKSFKTRKESIKKKTMELSVLCDVKACAVIIAPDGTVETWPENRNHVQEVIQIYKTCDRKRKRPQELDHESKKNQNGCFVSNQNQGPTNQEFLRMIDVKLAQVKKRIQFLKSNDQIQGSNQDGSNDYIDTISNEMFVSQDMTCCDQTIKNSLCFDTQLDEIQGLEETENFSLWLDSFLGCDEIQGLEETENFSLPLDSFLDKQPEIQDIQENPSWFDNLVGAVEQENQDIVKFTPNSFFNSGSELLETFSDQEFQPFTTTTDTFNPNTLDSGSVFMDSTTLWWDDDVPYLWV